MYQIKQIVSQVAKTFNYPVSIVFDNKLEDARLEFDKNKNEYFIKIGTNFNKEPLRDFDFETKITCKIIEVFHEYRHYDCYLNMRELLNWLESEVRIMEDNE